jgi:hypothetical protein
LGTGEHDFQSADLHEEEECGANSRSSDIWEDVSCMELLKRARKRNTQLSLTGAVTVLQRAVGAKTSGSHGTSSPDA